MRGSYSIRNLFVVVAIVAVAIGWLINLREKENLKSQITELRLLYTELALARKRFASCEIEFQHYTRLANAETEHLDAIFNSQRRRATASQQIADAQFQIDLLFGTVDALEQKLRRLEIYNTEIDQSRSILEKLELNPDSSNLDKMSAKQQIAYFESQASNSAK